MEQTKPNSKAIESWYTYAITYCYCLESLTVMPADSVLNVRTIF